MRRGFLYGLVLLAASASAQTEVTPYRMGATAEGVTYCLPRTAFVVNVTVKQTTLMPGTFCQYADRYLHLNNAPTARSTSWEIERLDVEVIGKPDMEKVYSIKLKDRTSASLVKLSKEGVILAINTAPPAQKEVNITNRNSETTTTNKLNSRDYMTEDILSATSTAKMAQLTAEEIYEIRESRNALTRGQADNLPKDGAQLKLMLERLETQDMALTQLFKGWEEQTTRHYTFVVDPQAEMKRNILFRFSKKLGIVDADDLSGEPIYLTIEQKQKLPEATELEMAKKKNIENGVRYNLPSRSVVKLAYGEKNLFEGEFPIAQFGVVETLSNTLFNKKSTTAVTFYDTNGGIMSISAE